MMATEASTAPVNGTYAHQHAYGGAEQSFGHQANNSTSTTGYASAPVSGSGPQQNEISKEEVAWYFVESYYTTMSKSPEKLHLFFNKRSQFVSGVEEEKSSVALGQKAIKERLADLDYQDCKVRVTNVDSQASDSNIVIQVLGEMSNKSQPHRKFAQTFVLAVQTNGYFVLNDIFRYIKDDEDEPETANADEGNTAASAEEPAPAVAEPAEPVADEAVVNEEDVAEVDQKLEEVQHEETSAPAVNGAPATEESEPVEAEEAPAAAESVPEPEEVETETAKEQLEPEKPKDPAPSPAPVQATPAAPSAPPKPAVPRTWAQLASANRAAAAAAAPAASATPIQAAPAAQPKASAPAAAPSVTSPTAATAATPAPPVREPSPVDSNKEGSSGGWQTAGADHGRKQSRAQNAPTVGSDGRVRAYVKNVVASVDAEALKTYLTKFGELVYFDVARGKNAAFVEYKTLAGFQAAVNANPHNLGGEEIWIEERRVAPSFNQRGGGRGGRGGFNDRPSQGRNFNKDAPSSRGGSFGGRGRGSGNVTPRGGRGASQAA